MYGELFCRVYNEFGWNYYPEVFGNQLLEWLKQNNIKVKTSMDLACGTGILCKLLSESGIEASGTDFSPAMIEIARENAPGLHFEVADMTIFCPEKHYDLVTCTGDAVNHISDIADVEKIFRNVYAYTAEGGLFAFDILNENEVSSSEPFEMDYSETERVWFQMTRPAENKVNLQIKVFENGSLSCEENIRETIHSPAEICELLKMAGFKSVTCSDRLLDSAQHGTTWFILAQK